MKDIIKTLRQYVEKIYHIYQLAWMMDQGLSLGDIFSQLLDDESGNTADAVESFEETGFNGSCYVCLGEFMTHEFTDYKYINGLVGAVANGEKLLQVYNKYFGDFYRELSWDEDCFNELDAVIIDEYNSTNSATLKTIEADPEEISKLYADVGLDITRWLNPR